MKRLFTLLIVAFLGTNALKAQWHEYYTGVTEDLYGVCCIDENTAFVCGENGVILKTEDGGETWVEKNRTEGVWLYDIKFLGNVGYAHAGWYVLKTTDGGETWQSLNTDSKKQLYGQKSDYNDEVTSYDLFLIDADTLYLFSSGLRKSEDSGVNWFYPAGADTPFAGFNPYTSKIYFQDNVGYVLSSTYSTTSEGLCITVWKTIDYGNTWDIVYEITDMEYQPWGFAVHFIDKDNVKIFPCYMSLTKDYPITDFYAIVTNDGFETYSIEPVENNGYYGSITDSKFTDANNGCYIAYQEWYGIDCKGCGRRIDQQNFACITKDGGQTWQFCYDGIDGQKSLYGIDGIDTIFYIAAEGGFIYRTGTPDKLYEWYDDLTNDHVEEDLFAPAGAEWYFGLSSFMGSPMSYYKMKVIGDTVITTTSQLRECSIITAPYLGGNGGNQYVYEENNVVYWYNATTKSFTKLYNFNANVGDSWICSIDTCSYQVTVTSIDSVIWGGRTYRVQNVTSDWNIMEGKIIDGIGYEGGLFPYMWACSYEVYDGTYPYYLRCYLEDGEMLYHEGSYDCNAVIEIDPFSYEAVLKPDADSISWIAWSRDTEEDIMQQTLYVKREADSIYLYKRSEISEETNLVGTLHEEGGRLWIKYRVYNIIEDVYYYYDVLVLDMTLNIGDNFVLPTGVTATVADVYYREGRKVIVFDSTMYSGEWKEPLMFIEGVGPNFISTDGPTEIYQNYISCKFEDGNRVYSTHNILFSECDYNAEIIAGKEWYYELQNPDGSITYQHLYYLADTVIDDRDIDIIVRNNTLYDKGSVTTHEYIYEESGKVYWWNATTGDFTTLYDFTANVGDEWEIKVGTESITMHVDAVGEIEYNNRVFKTLQVSDAGNLFSGTIVASVGHLTSFFPEKLMRKQGESSVEGLRCLWNGMELVFKYGDKDCDEVYEQLHLSLSEATTNSFSLYPNPTEGQLSITTASGGEYRITNLTGQTLLQGRLNSGSTSIDVSGLGNGMYFMTIEGRSKKFIVQ